MNIKLPFQKLQYSQTKGLALDTDENSSLNGTVCNHSPTVLLNPYIRRLVVTAFDSPSVLHGFFGDDWRDGVGPLHETERRNYLFATKSNSWLSVKHDYDMDDDQSVPFLRPLRNVQIAEIEAAELAWSKWLAMQDWMLGPRNPFSERSVRLNLLIWNDWLTTSSSQ